MEISVIVADDSAFLRKIISDILAENKSIKIIDRARNGREAVEKVLDLAPDVLLLDLIMPEMDGMEALKIIMREFPTPTIILSALSPENIDASVQALLIGAFDYIIKPGGLGAKDLPEFKEDLLSKVLLASKSLIKKHSEPHQYLLDRNVSLRQEVINKIFKFGELLKEVKPLNKNDKYIEGPLFESKNLEEKILKKINIQEIPETIEKINDLQVNKKKSMEILKVDDNLRKIERKTKKVRTQKTVIKKDVKKPSITEKKIKRFEKSIETRSLEFPNLKISKPIKNVNITTKVVIIGASVGGPKSLRTVLEQFPSDINCPILIVQHLNKKFVDVLAESLESTCALKVKVAENNEYIKPGIVYLSPGEKHMEISIKNKKPCIRLYFGEPVHHCIPSIDVLFKSAAKIYQNQALGILLTGMGEDGVEGLGIIKSFNGITIAESEETSILYGMPKSAARRGLADYIMPNYDIPKLIIKYLKE